MFYCILSRLVVSHPRHEASVVNKIQSHPKYLELRTKRNRLGIFLTVLMLVVYYGYIALIAFDKKFPGPAHRRKA
jgi:uncharacterized membrane protein (DUF485 family)